MKEFSNDAIPAEFAREAWARLREMNARLDEVERVLMTILAVDNGTTVLKREDLHTLLAFKARMRR